MRWRWNTKNNPRDYGIVENCVGIAELKPQSNLFKTHRYCCRALVHFHFSAFSSIFPPNWTAKQSVVFFSKPVFNTRRAGLRYSRAADRSFDRSHVLGLRENRRDIEV